MRNLIDVVGECQCDHIGIDSVDDTSRLRSRATVRLAHRHLVARLRLPVLCKGRIEFLIELSRRVVRNIENRDVSRHRHGDHGQQVYCQGNLKKR